MVGCRKYGKGTSRFHKMQGMFCLDEELLASDEKLLHRVSYVVYLFGWLVSLLCCFFLSFFLPSFLPSFIAGN